MAAPPLWRTRARAIPLIGHVETVRTLDWAEVSAHDPEFFERSLRELGFRGPELARALERRRQVAARLRSLEERQAALHRTGVQHLAPPPELRRLYQEAQRQLGRLLDVLKGVEYRPEETTTAKLDIPLFILSAPNEPGCEVTFTQRQKEGRALAWNVSLLFGLAGASFVRTTTSSREESFRTGHGHAKQIVAPYELQVTRFSVR